MITLQMHPDLPTKIFPTSSPVPGPESCTDPTTGLAVGAMPSLSIVALSPSSHHTDARPPPAKRPKLSLTTSVVPLTFGRSTTGLRASASTDSPTLRNSYVNAYEPYRRPSTSSEPTAPPSTQTAKIAPQSPIRPLTSPYRQEAPYKIPLGIRGILRNGPLPRRHFSATSARTPRRLFPDIKHVSYRSPLEEAVPDTRYLSDIEEVSEDEDLGRAIRDLEEKRNKNHKRTSERESHTQSEDHADRSGITAPGRRKRRREWVWTLEDSPELARQNKADFDQGTGLRRKSDVRVMDGLLDGDTTTVAEAVL